MIRDLFFTSFSFFLLIAFAGCANPRENQLPNFEPVSTGIYGGSNTNDRDPAANSVVKVIRATGACTGVVVSQDVVVTAAHCLHDDIPQVILQFEDGKKTIRYAEKMIRHPKYLPNVYPDKNRWDIGIVVFKGGLPAGIQPAKIFAGMGDLPVGTPVLAIGYGASKIGTGVGVGVLRKVSRSLSQSDYSNAEFTLGFDLRHGIAGGDSGGPALIKVGNEYQVLGVLSGHSSKNAFHDYFILYTRLETFRTWITQASARLR